MIEKGKSTISAKSVKKSFFSRFWWLLVAVLVLSLAMFGLYMFRNQQTENITENKNELKNTTSQKISECQKTENIFTHRIFDPEKVSHVTPLGELNGGYEETQTINGVMINIRKNANGDTEPIEVYAPTDMTLEDYSHFTDSRSNSPAQWHLGFRISKDIKLSFDHISWVPDNIKEVTPATPTSAYIPPTKKISFQAGELIAKTSGTKEAHNWNIYLRDNCAINTFVNQARYDAVRDGYDYVNAACPFDYYDETMKNQYLGLMGYSNAGQSKTCGSNSRDVKGTISGLWHLNKEGVRADYQGQYATPFSIYKTSAGEIVLYEINKKRYIVGSSNPTFKDPATITDSHCYNLTEYGDDRSTKGYVYVNIVSDMEMQMSYSASGNCPATFPNANAITYYR